MRSHNFVLPTAATPLGKEATRIVDALINPPATVPQTPAVPQSKPLPSIPPDLQQSFLGDPNKPPQSANFLTPDSQQTMFVSDQISQLKIENNFKPTNNSYPSTFYQQQQQPWKSADQQPTNKTLTNSYNSYSANSPLKTHHSHHLSPAAQPAANNAVRESLDDRLNHLFSKKGFGNPFFGELSGLGPNLSNLSSPSFESTGKHSQRNSDYYHRVNKDTTSHASFHSEQVLGTPPSPFLSYSEFIKSTKVTKAIDEGRNPSLSDEDNNNNDHNRSNSNSGDDEDNDVFNSQDTPKRKSFTRNRYRQSSRSTYNKKSINNSSAKYETMNDLDDDRMSLSSLSSGEKLELPNDSERVSFERRGGFVPFTINSNDSVLKRNKYGWNNSGDGVKLTNNTNNQVYKYQNAAGASSGVNISSSFFGKGRRPNHLSSKHRFNEVFDLDDDYGRREAAEDQSKFKRSRLQTIKQGVIKIVVAELKSIIQKDINKKMIESTAFQIYENWWDESEKQFKLKKEQKENQENLNSTEKTGNASKSAHKEDPAAISSVLSAVTYNKASNTNPFNLSGGYQFGHLRAAMPKMPSFRRKVKQTRNEEDRQNNKKIGLSDEEFENISSDDEAFNRKFGKNRSAAIIDNSQLDSVSDDSDDSSSNLSLSKRKRKQLTKNRRIRSSSSSDASSSSLSSNSDSSSNESSGSEEESGSESDTRSHRSSISASSLESFDRDLYPRSIAAGKKTKSSAASISSKKSSLLSSISQSSISSKSLSSYDEISRSSLSAIESEDDEISSRLSVDKAKVDERLEEERPEDDQQKVRIEKPESETEGLETEKRIESPVPEDKPVKRKVGRPPKANKQQKNKQDKALISKTTTATVNEKENVKPLKQDLIDERNENDLMTREEIEASEALMALSGLFGAPTSKQQNAAAGNLAHQPKPVIFLSERHKETQIRATYDESRSGVETDSASESELMNALFESPEERVAIDHAYCIRAKRKVPKSKYDNGNYDFSAILDDTQMQERVNEHLHSSDRASPSDLYGKVKGKKRQQAAAAGKKGRKSKAAKVNDENVDLNLIVEKPKIKFEPRSKEAEIEILYDIIQNGIDSEDVRYLKRGYDALLQEDENHAWLNETHWSDHPPTKISAPTKKKKKAEELRVHLTGCARSEGYYKMTDKEKAKSSYVVNATQGAEEGNENEDSLKAPRARVPTTQQATREARSNQRRLLATVDVAWSDLLKFNQLQFRKKQLKFARSKIHDWGLFALEPIAADEMVIEYVGQMIRPVVADLREKKYNEMGIGSSYLFRVDLETIIDATKVGNLARFINHSCTVSELLLLSDRLLSLIGRPSLTWL